MGHHHPKMVRKMQFCILFCHLQSTPPPTPRKKLMPNSSPSAKNARLGPKTPRSAAMEKHQDSHMAQWIRVHCTLKSYLCVLFLPGTAYETGQFHVGIFGSPCATSWRIWANCSPKHGETRGKLTRRGWSGTQTRP